MTLNTTSLDFPFETVGCVLFSVSVCFHFTDQARLVFMWTTLNVMNNVDADE